MRELEKAKIRVRNINKTEGEKASKFFLNLENRQMHHNRMIKLQDKSGNYIDQPRSMLKCVNQFYEHLCTSEGIIERQLLHILSGINTESFHEDILLENVQHSVRLSFCLSFCLSASSFLLSGLVNQSEIAHEH